MTATRADTRTPAAIAELAYAEVLVTSPRTPERRAAVCLYVAATVPPAKTVDTIRSAIATFGTDSVQAAALELLGRLTDTMTEPAAELNNAVIP